MSDLPLLADSAGQHLVKRSGVMRGAIVGAVLYGGFALEQSIFTLGNPRIHHSLLGTLAGTLFGVVAGAAMGLTYSAVLRRFARPKLGAHVLAGISAAPVLILPSAFLLRHFLAPHAMLVGALGVLVFGGCLGTMIRVYMYNRQRGPAA
jgi:drug/metabolite transporter (DMT)-like permease